MFVNAYILSIVYQWMIAMSMLLLSREHVSWVTIIECNCIKGRQCHNYVAHRVLFCFDLDLCDHAWRVSGCGCSGKNPLLLSIENQQYILKQWYLSFPNMSCPADRRGQDKNFLSIIFFWNSPLILFSFFKKEHISSVTTYGTTIATT